MDSTNQRPNYVTRRTKFVAILAIVLLATAGYISLGIYRSSSQPASRIPAELSASSIDFSVYYPTNLPKDVAFVNSNASTNEAIVSYALNTKGGGRIAVTIQKKPEGILFDDFYSRILQNKADIFNRHGKAVLGVADNKAVGSLVTDNEWVLVTAPISTDGALMTKIMSNLTPVN